MPSQGSQERSFALWGAFRFFGGSNSQAGAAFAALTFPLKVVLMDSIPGALFLSFVREGSGLLLTCAMRSVYRVVWPQPSGKMIAILVFVSGIAGTLQTGFLLMMHKFFPLEEEMVFTGSVQFIVFYQRMGLLLAWSFLYYGIRQAIAGVKRDLRLALLESARREAEIQLLRAQMNPHFLFNALNTIRNGVEKANAQLGSTVESLADFLRFSLDHARDDFIPLGREFDAMQNYLRVEKTRFRGKLEYECHIDENARAVPAPGIVLQPLVENAIKYGQDTSDLPLRVSVQVLRQADTLKIVVANTGDWLEPAPREKTSHIGLENLRRRLELLYPRRHRLDITPADGWVTITIHLPVL